MNWLRRLPEAPIASTFLALNLAVFVLMVVRGHQLLAFNIDTLVWAGANVVPAKDAVVDVSHWRWLTAAFIHVNLVHLLMNMVVLVQLGVLSERFIGAGLLAGTYVVTGISGNVVSSVWAAHRGTQLLSAGASGSIMGLLGMVAVLAWTADLKPLAKSLLRNAAFIIALGVALSVSGRGLVDNGAHVGGLLTGALIGWVRARYRRPMPRTADRVLVVASFALILVAFGSILAAGGAR
jgi:rhomboid protease GluP